jgi:hypothetical protein
LILWIKPCGKLSKAQPLRVRKLQMPRTLLTMANGVQTKTLEALEEGGE